MAPYGTQRATFGYSGSGRWYATMDHHDLPGWIAEMHVLVLTAIGLELRQRLDAPEQLPPALAALLAHADGNNKTVQGSKVEELGALATAFNDMAAKLQKSFDDLVGEVEVRKSRERELQESEARLIRANAAMHEAQAELALVARLTTIGELAASIAHEINQPLAAVVANGNAALRWLAHSPPNLEETRHSIKAILNEGNRASEVIGRIRSLLKHRAPDYVELDINDVIRGVLELTGSALRSRGVVIETQLPEALPQALGDRVQLQQVIMNLIMNGADAMSAISDRPCILHIGSQIDSAGSLLVSVKDSGTGIDEAIRESIFKPLFTTKSTGMGMGLSICRSIIEAHGGKLWATPATPYGTDFRFTIPPAASRRLNAERPDVELTSH
jgi:signal transduction histidine kinase